MRRGSVAALTLLVAFGGGCLLLRPGLFEPTTAQSLRDAVARTGEAATARADAGPPTERATGLVGDASRARAVALPEGAVAVVCAVTDEPLAGWSVAAEGGGALGPFDAAAPFAELAALGESLRFDAPRYRARTLALSDGELVVDRRVRLDPETVLRGVVTFPDGAPAAGATVFAVPWPSWREARGPELAAPTTQRAEVDASGAFALPVVRDDALLCVAGAGAFAPPVAEVDALRVDGRLRLEAAWTQACRARLAPPAADWDWYREGDSRLQRLFGIFLNVEGEGVEEVPYGFSAWCFPGAERDGSWERYGDPSRPEIKRVFLAPHAASRAEATVDAFFRYGGTRTDAGERPLFRASDAVVELDVRLPPSEPRPGRLEIVLEDAPIELPGGPRFPDFYVLTTEVDTGEIDQGHAILRPDWRVSIAAVRPGTYRVHWRRTSTSCPDRVVAGDGPGGTVVVESDRTATLEVPFSQFAWIRLRLPEWYEHSGDRLTTRVDLSSPSGPDRQAQRGRHYQGGLWTVGEALVPVDPSRPYSMEIGVRSSAGGEHDLVRTEFEIPELAPGAVHDVVVELLD